MVTCHNLFKALILYTQASNFLMLPMNCPHTVDHKKKMVSPLFHPFPLAKTTLVFFIPFSVSLHNNSGLTLWSNIHQEITLCFRRIQPHLHPSIANWINSCKPSPVFFFFFSLLICFVGRAFGVGSRTRPLLPLSWACKLDFADVICSDNLF